MRIRRSPQRSDLNLSYTFNGEVIECTYGEQTDVFDFSAMPEGKMVGIETDLPINPIISAERINGELFVELLYFHGATATDAERFPDWQVVS